jgi:O-antigen biosynthesis protein WbqV
MRSDHFAPDVSSQSWDFFKRKLVKKLRRLQTEVSLNRRLFAADVLFCGVAAAAGMVLRLGFFNDLSRFSPLLILIPLAMLVGALTFPLAGLYRRDIRSTSLPDALVAIQGAAAMSVLLVLVWGVVRNIYGFPQSAVPRSSFLIMLLALVPLLIAARLAGRRSELFRANRLVIETKATNRIPILLVGTGTSCDLFLRSIFRDSNRSYTPIGIVDDVQQTRGLIFHEVPILGSVREIDQVITLLSTEMPLPQRIVLTEPVTHFNSEGIERLIRWADQSGIAVSRLPALSSFREATADPKAVVGKAIHVADILNRPQKVIERSLLQRMISGRRVLVTGAGGSIGSELVRQIASLNPAELVLMDHSEYNLYVVDMDLVQHFPTIPRCSYLSNIRDPARVNFIFEQHKPELVFHAAALKHVPMVELNPCEGILTNVIGTRNVADASRRVGAMAMVQVSTDKAVNATNVMGATKRVAEFYCQAMDNLMGDRRVGTRFMTVRFGNVLGSSGSLIPLFEQQISQGGPLTVTDPRMERFFMTIREAVELTLLASAHGLQDRAGHGEIFVLDMGEPVKIMDIAERMIRLAGLRPGVDIEIKIIGARPGEKLFEELFDHAEESRPSSINGVSVAIPAQVSLAALNSAISRLQAAAFEGDDATVIDILCELVPGYHPAKRVRPVASTDRRSAEVAQLV